MWINRPPSVVGPWGGSRVCSGIGGWGPGIAKKTLGTEAISGGSLMSVTRGGCRLCETGHALELYMSNLFTIHSRLPAIQSQN